ncbi:Haemolysin XhlA, partial [Tissierella praeacuta DSM 18095]
FNANFGGVKVENKICEERHKRIDEKISVHERRINNHSERLDIIERVNSRLEERLDGLIKQLASLNSTMKWFMGLLLGGIVSFFFYAVQQGLFK